MPSSSYFATSKFRGVDAQATSDTMPLTSTLEAQLSCSQDWLHVNAGGSTARIQNAKNLSQTAYNDSFHVAATWASLMMQPFLVTRGLKSIRLTVLGTFEDQDTAARLDLQGIKSQDAIWGIGATSTTNTSQQIMLVLDEPATVEYETDLVLWVKSRFTSTFATTAALVTATDGQLEAPAAVVSAVGKRTLAMVHASRSIAGSKVLVNSETLYRSQVSVSGSGSFIAKAILSDRTSGSVYMGEVGLARITTRSIFVEQFFA